MHTESDFPPKALWTRDESFPSPWAYAELLIMLHSCHPSPWPNFSMAACSHNLAVAGVQSDFGPALRANFEAARKLLFSDSKFTGVSGLRMVIVVIVSMYFLLQYYLGS